MNHSLSFTALFLTALGLVFIMPQSPLSMLTASLEIQSPAVNLIAGTDPVTGGGGTNNSPSGTGGSNVDTGSGAGTRNVSAGSGGGGTGRPLEPVLKDPTIKGFLMTLINELIKVGYVVGVIYIVYAGFLFVTGGESDAKRTKARNTLMWTIIGIGILLGAQAIALIVSSTIEAIANSST
jgi:hypothetical protein